MYKVLPDSSRSKFTPCYNVSSAMMNSTIMTRVIIS